MSKTMLMDENGNRKRMRSNDDDGPFVIQRKTFVNQHMMDVKDQAKMQLIQAKTMGLLFQGARKSIKRQVACEEECLSHIRLMGGGEVDFDVQKCPRWLEKKSDRNCRSCNHLAMVHAACNNCNLELCEYCGVSCSYCPEKICMNCITVFMCSSNDLPCCEGCKMFL